MTLVATKIKSALIKDIDNHHKRGIFFVLKCRVSNLREFGRGVEFGGIEC